MEGTLAQIFWFAGNFAPRGWAFCAGQIIPISQNTALFSLLGTTYGGDGRTTFALPDFRGRAPRGTGQGPGLSQVDLGEQSGTPTYTLITNQMPAHTHVATATVAVASTNGSSSSPAANIFATSAANAYGSVANVNGSASAETLNLANAGSGQPFSIQPPSLGMNFVICMQGVFPLRN